MMTAKFLRAIGYVLRWEGVDADHPADRGGRTRFGISQAAYPDTDIASLTLDDARAIYDRDYWRHARLRCDLIEPSVLATKVLDFAVVAGPHQSAMHLQTALVDLGADIIVDGTLGPLTRYAITATVQRYTARHLIAHLAGLHFTHFYSLAMNNRSQRAFLAGWSLRAHTVPE